MAIHNFPQQSMSFVGREQEISDLTALLDDSNCQLITLVGPGGIGKSRLVLEVIQRKTGVFADGVYFVPLQPLRAGEHIQSSLIETLGFPVDKREDLRAQLVDHLREKQALLVFDNFEHLLDGAELLIDLLASAPRLKILATSREPLNLREEWLRQIRGLSYPANGSGDPTTYEAVQLFTQRARQQRGDFRLEDELEAVLRICQLTEGMPLALELAAAWVRSLSCAAIAVEIERRIDFLAINARNVPERHRSMRAVFDQSWQMLSAEEARIMRGLTVFRGGCTHEAAEAILGASLNTLSRLVDKSLLRHKAETGRYEIQELQRQYAEAQLDGAGEGDELRDVHCHYYAGQIHARRGDRQGHGKNALLALMQAELDNIRAAWAWALERGHYEVIDQLVELLWMYHTDYSAAFELGRLCQGAADALSAASGRRERAILGRVLARQGKWEHNYGRLARAEALFRQSMAIALEQDNLDDYYYAMRWLAHYVIFQTGSDLLAVRQMLDECATYYRTQDDKRQLYLTLGNLSQLSEVMGDTEQCRRLTFEIYELSLTMDYAQGLAESVGCLGRLAFGDGHWAEAERWLLEALERYQLCKHRRGMMRSQAALAWTVVMLGDFARAEQLCDAALALCQRAGSLTNAEFGTALDCAFVQSLIADARDLPAEALSQIDGAQTLVNQRLGAGSRLSLALLYKGWILCSLEAYDTASAQIVAFLSTKDNIRNSACEVTRSIVGERPLVLVAAARILAHRGESIRAAELLGLVLTHPNGPRGYLEKHQGMTRLRRDLEAQLGAEAYAAAWERGAKLDVEQVARDVLREFSADPIAQANESLPDPLTPRELEVLSLIASRLSNPQIAERLYVTTGTIKSYTHKIYSKLAVENRSQAVTRAQELQLL